MQHEEEHPLALERDLLELSAREQIRQARDLHDGLREYFSGLAFHAGLLASDLHQARSSQAPQADRIVAILRTINQISRQVNRALQGAEMEAGGLAAAVRALVAEFERATGVRCEIAVGGPLPQIEAFRSAMLFRIVQDAFSYNIEHAQPRTIRVSLAPSADALLVSVIGDGHVGATDEAGGSKLRSTLMRLRAELIGATLEVGPVSAGSCKVECLLPISNAALIASDSAASFAR